MLPSGIVTEPRDDMRRIGLLGGMSWESTALYYRRINQLVAERRGGLHSAELVLVSVDFAPIEALQRTGRWDEAGQRLARAAGQLERAGAGALVLCTNTMHRVAHVIEAAITIPLLHIADATALAITAAGHRRVGLLGTRFTMEQAFYRGRLRDRFGLEVLTPEAEARAAVHRIIYEELCRGILREESRALYRRVITELHARGAEALILGCTEIGLLVTAADAPVPLHDTTELHARRAVDWALAD
jgi:aspartate racemase